MHGVSEPTQMRTAGANGAAPVTQEANVASDLLDIFKPYWPQLVCTLLAAAAVACAVHLLKAPRYNATAVLQLDLKTLELAPKGSASTTMTDASYLVESNMRLLQSDEIARRVVERLGLEKFSDTTAIAASSNTSTPARPSPVDLATARLLSSLVIKNDARTYLISIGATARDPQTAALIANTYASEFLQYLEVRRLADAVTIARRTATDLAVTLGQKHPLMMRAQSQLAEAAAKMEAAKKVVPAAGEQELADNAQVIPARSSTIPSGPRFLLVLAIALLTGALLWVAMVNLWERHAIRAFLLKHFASIPAKPRDTAALSG